MDQLQFLLIVLAFINTVLILLILFVNVVLLLVIVDRSNDNYKTLLGFQKVLEEIARSVERLWTLRSKIYE